MAEETDRPPEDGEVGQDEASPDKLLLTTKEVARLLSMSRTVVYQLIRRKELFSVKIGGARRIPTHAVHTFVHDLMMMEK